MKNFVISLLICLVQLTGIAQDKSSSTFSWPRKAKAAVCLTYDDGLDCHLDKAAPMLEKYGFRGTFYCTGNSTSLQKRLSEWRALSKRGHELGNHTLFHPCDGKRSSWVKPEYDFQNYTMNQIKNELYTANTLLKAIDGKTERTFAYTCTDCKVGNLSFVDTVKTMFLAARGGGAIPENMDQLDLYYVPSWGVDSPTGKELIAYIEKAKQAGTLAVFMFHSVGGGYLNVSEEAHEELLKYLKKHKDEFYTDTFMNVMKYVKHQRAGSEASTH